MFCIAPIADPVGQQRPGEAWRILQVFEFMAFPLDHASVEMLVIVVARNQLSTPQHLNILHRARVEAQLVDLTDRLLFPTSAGPHALSIWKVLSQRFRLIADSLEFRPRKDRFTLSDHWIETSIWRPRDQEPSELLFPVCRSAAPTASDFCPYTGLRIGPFRGLSLFTLGFRMTIVGPNYQRLVGSYDHVTLKGHQSVLYLIENVDIPMYQAAGGEQASTLRDMYDRLSNLVIEPDSYEILLAREPLSRGHKYEWGAPSVLRVPEQSEPEAAAFDHLVAQSSEFTAEISFSTSGGLTKKGPHSPSPVAST